ncbi:hypothetical protein [Brevibacillus sp. 179-C9.3 HS]|uniref:hypothetical protein n=1 Tax=unclassified Brevibacillus TaxID=2684853 RepID=UPI0039A25FA8
MTKVISNSSPIIALSMIGHLSLMNELFEEVFIPAGVYREIVESESIREHGKRELQVYSGSCIVESLRLSSVPKS